MFQAHPISFFLRKYCWLIISVSMLVFSFFEYLNSETKGLDKIIISAGLCLVSTIIFIVWSRNIKQVAIGRMKLIVKDNGSEKEYSWLDVDFIHLERPRKLYELKLKGKNSIYFLPYDSISLLGDSSEMGDIIRKAKKDYNL